MINLRSAIEHTDFLKSSSTKILILIIATCCVYVFSFNNQFVWDDEQFIYKNRFVTEFKLKQLFGTSTTAGAGIDSNYYRPLTSLSFSWDWLLSNGNELFFHVTNTGLHLGAGLALLTLLKRLGLNQSACFWISLIFLIHPLQTEAVTYINSRGDSLYTLLLLLSLISLDAYLKKQKHVKFRKMKFETSPEGWLMLSSILFGLSILAKEIAVAGLGLMVLTSGYWLWQQIKLRGSDWIEQLKQIVIGLLPAAFLVALYLTLRATLLNFSNSFNFYDEVNVYSSSLGIRLLTFSKILLIYFRLLLIPYPLHMERTVEIITNPINLWTMVSLLILGGLTWIGYQEIKQQKTAWIWLGLGWFFIMLAPVSGLVPINGLLYEHWLYLPQVGFWLILWGIFKIFKSRIQAVWPKFNKKSWQQLSICLLLPLLVAYGLLTIRQNIIWTHPIRFYQYTLNYTQSARLHNNLAMAYSDEGNFQAAIEHYQQALKLGSNYPQIYHNLGNAYQRQQQIERAKQYYQQALELNPDFFYSYQPLLSIYWQQENYPAAATILEKMLQRDPGNRQLVQLLIQTWLKQDRPAQAKEVLRRIYPNHSDKEVDALLEQIINAAKIMKD